MPQGCSTFQQEFDNPSAPLLRANGGQFYPYFTYFGGDAQPDGPNGYRGWNDEQQVYTTSIYTPAPFNPYTVSNSVLTITGKPNPAGNLPKPYLSGCIETSKGAWWDPASTRDARGGFEQKYGYWESRIKIPKGKGVWPAFWLAGGIQAGVGGEKQGEIDIFECIGDGKIYQSVHDWWAASDPNTSYGYVPAFDYSADFHVYGFAVDPTSIIWYIDGVETHRAPDATCARYAPTSADRCTCVSTWPWVAGGQVTLTAPRRSPPRWKSTGCASSRSKRGRTTKLLVHSVCERMSGAALHFVARVCASIHS